MRYKIDANASSTPLHASRKNETEDNDAFEELAAGRAGDKKTRFVLLLRAHAAVISAQQSRLDSQERQQLVSTVRDSCCRNQQPVTGTARTTAGCSR